MRASYNSIFSKSCRSWSLDWQLWPVLLTTWFHPMGFHDITFFCDKIRSLFNRCRLSAIKRDENDHVHEGIESSITWLQTLDFPICPGHEVPAIRILGRRLSLYVASWVASVSLNSQSILAIRELATNQWDKVNYCHRWNVSNYEETLCSYNRHPWQHSHLQTQIGMLCQSLSVILSSLGTLSFVQSIVPRTQFVGNSNVHVLSSPVSHSWRVELLFTAEFSDFELTGSLIRNAALTRADVDICCLDFHFQSEPHEVIHWVHIVESAVALERSNNFACGRIQRLCHVHAKWDTNWIEAGCWNNLMNSAKKLQFGVVWTAIIVCFSVESFSERDRTTNTRACKVEWERNDLKLDNMGIEVMDGADAWTKDKVDGSNVEMTHLRRFFCIQVVCFSFASRQFVNSSIHTPSMHLSSLPWPIVSRQTEKTNASSEQSGREPSQDEPSATQQSGKERSWAFSLKVGRAGRKLKKISQGRAMNRWDNREWSLHEIISCPKWCEWSQFTVDSWKVIAIDLLKWSELSVPVFLIKYFS